MIDYKNFTSNNSNKKEILLDLAALSLLVVMAISFFTSITFLICKETTNKSYVSIIKEIDSMKRGYSV